MMEDHPCHLCAHRATTSILGLGSSVANPIYLWVYNEISDENLDREEFIYF